MILFALYLFIGLCVTIEAYRQDWERIEEVIATSEKPWGTIPLAVSLTILLWPLQALQLILTAIVNRGGK